jgi:hypothetical protein
VPGFPSALRQMQRSQKRKRWRAAKPFRWELLSIISRLAWQGSQLGAHERAHGARPTSARIGVQAGCMPASIGKTSESMSEFRKYLLVFFFGVHGPGEEHHSAGCPCPNFQAIKNPQGAKRIIDNHKA